MKPNEIKQWLRDADAALGDRVPSLVRRLRADRPTLIPETKGIKHPDWYSFAWLTDDSVMESAKLCHAGLLVEPVSFSSPPSSTRETRTRSEAVLEAAVRVPCREVLTTNRLHEIAAALTRDRGDTTRVLVASYPNFPPELRPRGVPHISDFTAYDKRGVWIGLISDHPPWDVDGEQWPPAAEVAARLLPGWDAFCAAVHRAIGWCSYVPPKDLSRATVTGFIGEYVFSCASVARQLEWVAGSDHFDFRSCATDHFVEVKTTTGTLDDSRPTFSLEELRFGLDRSEQYQVAHVAIPPSIVDDFIRTLEKVVKKDKVGIVESDDDDPAWFEKLRLSCGIPPDSARRRRNELQKILDRAERQRKLTLRRAPFREPEALQTVLRTSLVHGAVEVHLLPGEPLERDG